MILTVPSPAFPLGHLVATPGALQALEEAGEYLQAFVVRHACADVDATLALYRKLVKELDLK